MNEDTAIHQSLIDLQLGDELQAEATAPTSEHSVQDPMEVDKEEESQETAIKEETPPPLSEFESLQASLAEKVYDAAAWNRLVDLAEESGDLAKVKEVYEALLKAYPNTVRLFFLYIVSIFTCLTRLNLNLLTLAFDVSQRPRHRLHI